jgi:hypothetical protein
MNIESLNKLRLNDDGIYEFFVKTRTNTGKVPLFIFECTERHNLRMDLVSLDVYQTADYIDVLCNLNGILNPLMVQEGDIILYTNEDNIDDINNNGDLLEEIRAEVTKSNIGKQFKQDKARQNDLLKRRQVEADKKFIPPNILQAGESNIEITEDGPDFSPKDGQIQRNNIIIKPSF